LHLACHHFLSQAVIPLARNVRLRIFVPMPATTARRRTERRGSYRTCNVIKRLSNRIKHFRRISTRYDELARSYLVHRSPAPAIGPLIKM
jgi:transposase